MSNSQNILLLSIKPKYAHKIFTEEKKVELRRVKTRLKTGDIVVIYVTSPHKKIAGFFQVKNVDYFENNKKERNKIWQEIEKKSGITKQEFTNYYQGARLGVIIFIDVVKKFEYPIRLEILRHKIDKFTPPQSYRYLTNKEIKIIEQLTKEKIINTSSLIKI